jgi:NAD(P)-dependent dehydrogenase (short-subunit alcohol dehydrogenase family)
MHGASGARLAGKVAIVTGSSRGIGKVIALHLAQAGAAVVVTGRSEASTPELPGSIGETRAAIEASGGRAIAVRADVAVDADLRRIVDETVQAFGRIDMLVNNAAYLEVRGGFLDGDVRSLDDSLRANVRAPFLLTQLVAARMKEHGGGVLVHISSGAATNPEPPIPNGPPPMFREELVYAMTKAALDHFSTGIAREMMAFNIASGQLRPGFTLTERFQLQPPPGMDLSEAEPPDGSAAGPWCMICADPMAYNGKIVTWQKKSVPKTARWIRAGRPIASDRRRRPPCNLLP